MIYTKTALVQCKRCLALYTAPSFDTQRRLMWKRAGFCTQHCYTQHFASIRRQCLARTKPPRVDLAGGGAMGGDRT